MESYQSNLRYLCVCEDAGGLRTPKVDVRRIKNFLEPKHFQGAILENPESQTYLNQQLKQHCDKIV